MRIVSLVSNSARSGSPALTKSTQIDVSTRITPDLADDGVAQ